jgi:predicted glycoside hydrolase/deacetylase ChbG (UPF0249 family)
MNQVYFVRLVTRGDDAGMCHTVNVAIRDACERGILRNVSLLVPGPAFAEAAAMFAQFPGIDVGLHLDLTAEWAHLRWGPVLPVENVPSLVNEHGHFFHWCQDLHAHGAVLAQMQAEVQAQLDTARAHGLNIAYLDEHMGVGWINGLGEWLVDFCQREGLICNRTLLETGRLQRLPRADDAPNAVEAVLTGLNAATPGTYLLVGHPVYKTEEILRAHLPDQAPGIEATNRDWQRRMFMDDTILEFVRERGVQPIRYTEI